MMIIGGLVGPKTLLNRKVEQEKTVNIPLPKESYLRYACVSQRINA